MDDVEKKVLRRKRHVFAENVEVNEEFLQGMQRAGLLDAITYRGVMNERTNSARALKLLDHVFSCHGNAFDLLMSALLLEHAWLAKELECDVRCEKGDLHLDDDVEREAGMLVHRKFGCSRRLSEFDKKEITETIAMKIQMSKEEWKQELNSLRHQHKQVLGECEEKDREVQAMDKHLNEFIRQHRQALVSRAHDLTSTSDTLRTSAHDDDVITKLKERLCYLLERMRRVIVERELLQNDREKSFALLGVGGDNNSLMLNEVIALKLVDMPQSVQTYQDELQQKEQTVKRVRRLLQDYESEAENKERRISRLENDLVHKDKQMALLEEKIRQLEREKQNRQMVIRAQTEYNTRTKAAIGSRTSAKPGKKRGGSFPSIVADKTTP